MASDTKKQSLISNLLSLLLLFIPLLYLATLAQTLVLGDPTEYTFVANVLGIAHPPGYAFITLVGKLFQTLIPVGTIPWRMHLLAATSATLAAIFIYGTVRVVSQTVPARPAGSPRALWLGAGTAALFAAFSVATAADVWQHAIHANPHMITATFLLANLFLLSGWWRSLAGDPEGLGNTRWLYAFSLSAGLGVTHHPLTVFGFPAYALFILAARPGILRRWRTVLKMLFFALLGLSVWLYYPLRSPMEPVFGPHNMNTLDGFLDHTLARGLTGSLSYYGLPDQPARAIVFWSLLRLQYSLPTIFLALLGAGWLLRRQWRLLLLYGGALLGNYLYVINLRVQDIMAYLLGSFMVIGLFAGIGFLALLLLLRRRVRLGGRALALLAIVLFLLGPILQLARNLPHISLRDYDEGVAHVEAVFDSFEGKGEGAVLLHDWEHITPMWYKRFVEGRWPDPADVRPEFVSTARPWVESVFATLPGGPVYLSGYRGEVVDAGFRLRPRGPFYQVVEPGESSIPPEIDLLDRPAPAGEIQIAGYWLPERTAEAGSYVPLALAMTAPLTPTAYYVPVLEVGELTYAYTTDHHLLTSNWQAGEVIVERFDFALPHDLPAGDYPLTLQVRNLSDDTLTDLSLSLGTLAVSARANPPPTGHLLANFRQRVGLVSARAGNGRHWRQAPWSAENPLPARPGDTLNLLLQWESLAKAEESYTIFVHLIDAGNRPLVALDYTPLGGSAPTHLWIPKWLPGQRYLDPYRLPLPPDLPPGTYYVEVGLYEMTGKRRLHISDQAGNLSGDRYILGPVEVRGH